MAKGRPPKPVEVKRREGNRGKTAATQPVVIGGKVAAPERPVGLSARARKVWAEVVPDLHAGGVLDSVDGPILGVFCELIAMTRRAWKLADETGPVRKGKRGSTKAGELAAALDLTAQVRQYAEQYGLTPSARSRLGVGKPSQPASPKGSSVGESPRLRAVRGGKT